MRITFATYSGEIPSARLISEMVGWYRISAFGSDDDVAFSQFVVKEIGVAVVPGSSFYHEPSLGRKQVRFTFCKRDETLAAAEEQLQN